MVRTGVTFADAAAEWLRFVEEDREHMPSTLRDYRSSLNAHLLPAFGGEPIEAISVEAIERWRRSLSGLSNRSKNKLLMSAASSKPLLRHRHDCAPLTGALPVPCRSSPGCRPCLLQDHRSGTRSQCLLMKGGIAMELERIRW